MANKILREFTKRPITILTTATHERYQSNFKFLPYNFVMWNHAKSKKWHEFFADIPDNHTYVNRITPNIKIDLALCQNKNSDYDVLSTFAKKNKIPLIQLEHTVCSEDASYDYVKYMYDRKGDINVFITDYSAKMWGFRKYHTVNHMVNSDCFMPRYSKEKRSSLLSVVNDYKERNRECGFDIWKKVDDKFETRLIGTSNCGISTAAKNTNELVKTYQDHLFFLNTSLVSPLPMSLLEAMSCGLCCISTNTCEIPNVISHGENGFLYDPSDANGMLDLINNLYELPIEQILKIGSNARKTVENNFGKEKFIQNWSNIIEKAACL